jgi:hypothetical protein
MFDPVREIYEMEFRQQDLARELEHYRLVKAARQTPNGRVQNLWSRVGYWWHVLGRIRQINIAISFDLNEPFVDGAGRQRDLCN